MSAKVPNAPGRTLVFPSLQTYSNDEVVRWIGPSDADEPAPRVTLAAKEPEGGATATTAAAEEAEDEENGRANLALGFGIAGLVAGLAGLGAGLIRRR